MQPLGKNINGYLGETLDIAAVLADCADAARQHGWSIEDIPVRNKPPLMALTRAARPDAPKTKRVYISTGIHGDEPAGPLAMQQLLQEDQWPVHLSLSLLPCLNPTGFPLNSRANSDGFDLNREYLDPKADEIIAHIAWLGRQERFDVCLALHEDWESHGFYLYELNPYDLPTLADAMLSAVEKVCPIDLSPVIEGRPAHNGLIRPIHDPRDRPQWPESFYLLTNKTQLAYTLEAPSDFPLAGRVAALVAAVKAAVCFIPES